MDINKAPGKASTASSELPAPKIVYVIEMFERRRVRFTESRGKVRYKKHKLKQLKGKGVIGVKGKEEK